MAGRRCGEKDRPTTDPVNLREAEAQATRRDLIWAAISLLHERGEAGVTMAAVAKRASRSRGTAYHHFRDRQHLLDSVREDLAQQLGDVAVGNRRAADPFAFSVEMALNAPETVRLESLSLLREGREHPQIAGLRGRLFAAKTEGQAGISLSGDMDCEAAATLIICSTWIAADIYMSGRKGKADKKVAARKFGAALKQLFFHGFLDEEIHKRFFGP